MTIDRKDEGPVAGLTDAPLCDVGPAPPLRHPGAAGIAQAQHRSRNSWSSVGAERKGTNRGPAIARTSRERVSTTRGSGTGVGNRVPTRGGLFSRADRAMTCFNPRQDPVTGSVRDVSLGLRVVSSIPTLTVYPNRPVAGRSSWTCRRISNLGRTLRRKVVGT